jgi:hypothetical protein
MVVEDEADLATDTHPGRTPAVDHDLLHGRACPQFPALRCQSYRESRPGSPAPRRPVGVD